MTEMEQIVDILGIDTDDRMVIPEEDLEGSEEICLELMKKYKQTENDM